MSNLPHILPKARILYGTVSRDGLTLKLSPKRTNGDKTYVLVRAESIPSAYDLKRFVNRPYSEKVRLGVEALQKYDKVHSASQPCAAIHGQVAAILRSFGMDNRDRA